MSDRFPWLAALSTLLPAAGVVVLVVALSDSVLAIVVALIAFVPASYLTWVRYSRTKSRLAVQDLATAADRLAREVELQWIPREAAPGRADPRLMTLSWRAADPDLTEDWTSLAQRAVDESAAGSTGWATGPAELAGSGDLRVVLEQIPTGRLVVIGAPGSGKSSMMMSLVLSVLRHRARGAAVPVLVPLSSWSPAREGLDEWLARRLAEIYPALGVAVPHGDGPAPVVQALLESGLIIPILDGLDEVQPQALAISRINESLRAEVQYVLTSRTAEFREMMFSAGGQISLHGATCVELLPLGIPAIVSYLQANNSQLEWRGFGGQLAANIALTNVLSNPSMLSLLGIICEEGTGKPHDIPRELSDLLRLPDETAIERHLLDSFLSLVYNDDFSRLHTFWRTVQIERWLTFVADHMRSLKTNDFTWWRLAAQESTDMLARLTGVPILLGLLLTWGGLALTHNTFSQPSTLESNVLWYLAASFGPALVAAQLVVARMATGPAQEQDGGGLSNARDTAKDLRYRAFVAGSELVI